MAVLAELQPFDNEKVRLRAHAMLPRAADRRAFDETSAGLSHAALIAHAARMIVRAEVLASYAAPPTTGDRVSGIRPVPVARIALAQVEAGRVRTG
jgi:hypothetical protein